jgi:CHAD domain-containing protein
MAYRLKVSKPLTKAVRRVAREQVDRALGEIEDRELDRRTTVHQVRKRCKKLRGLLRLVRPGLGATYAAENAAFRDAARQLSELRDAEVLRETYDWLLDHYAAQVDRPTLSPIRRQLTRRLEQRTVAGEVDSALEQVAAALRAARERIGSWKVDADDPAAVVAAGLERTYRRGRKGMARAYDKPEPERFHEWRKRAKYHWYHLRLLKEAWPQVITAYSDQADELSDLLGDAHDLAVLRATLLDDPESFAAQASVDTVAGLAERRRRELEELARPLGQRIYAAKPSCCGRSVGTWFETAGRGARGATTGS